MRTRDLIIAPLLCCLLALPGPALAAPADEGDGEQAEGGEGGEEEEVDPAKLEEAKKLYIEAEKLAAEEKWKEAEDKYEQAYYLVPGKHGFAHKVGMAAHMAEDCPTAVEYMVHFLQYATEEKYEPKRVEARDVLKASIERGCTTEAEVSYLHLTAQEREDKARELYVKAEELAAAENWAEATETYEQAYLLVPSKVGFSHKVGMAAHKLGDCDKAHEYLIHYVEYADPATDSDKMSEASATVQELERSGCVSSQEMQEHSFENPFEIDPGAGPGDDSRSDKGKANKGMLAGGSVLLIVGLGGVGAGVAGFVLSGSAQSKLDALASTDTPTGLPDADYSCRDVPSDACPPTLENQISNFQLLGIVGVSVGAAALIGGIALLAAGAKGGKGKSKGKQARLDSFGPMMLPGGGGAAATLSF